MSNKRHMDDSILLRLDQYNQEKLKNIKLEDKVEK